MDFLDFCIIINVINDDCVPSPWGGRDSGVVVMALQSGSRCGVVCCVVAMSAHVGGVAEVIIYTYTISISVVRACTSDMIVQSVRRFILEMAFIGFVLDFWSGLFTGVSWRFLFVRGVLVTSWDPGET